jgi:hypothetical protein
MTKKPFERVFSLIERKKILRRVSLEKISVLIKVGESQVYEFKVTGIDSSFNLDGFAVGYNPRDFQRVTALFYVDKERYLLNTRLRKMDSGLKLLSDSQFFRFNRRSAFRISIPARIEIFLFVESIRNIEVQRKLPIIEVSTGGARIHWSNNRRLAPGTPISGYLQYGKGSPIPIKAVVAHALGADLYGIRFVHLTTGTLNRLKVLSVQIQQEIHFS